MHSRTSHPSRFSSPGSVASATSAVSSRRRCPLRFIQMYQGYGTNVTSEAMEYLIQRLGGPCPA